MATQYDKFCDLIETARRQGLKIGNVTAPAFFLDGMPSATPGTIQLPFEEFWVITRLEGFDCAIFIRDTGVNRLEHWSYSNVYGKWMAFPVANKTVFHDFVLGLIQKINNGERERVETESLRTLNHGRAKSKVKLVPVPRFIRIGGPLRVSQNQPHTGTGSSRSPHERIGHWRNYRSGKRVWVRDCKIHGGSYVPRNYRVE